MENELSLAELIAYRGQGRSKVTSNGWERYCCPLHKGDKKTVLSLDPVSGWYHCHKCHKEGFLTEYREEWLRQKRAERGAAPRRHEPPVYWPKKAPDPQADPRRAELLQRYQAALTPDSPGARYLAGRGIPLALAKLYGLGYAAPGKWDGRARQRARLVVPHRCLTGAVVNLYGRSMEPNDQVPREEQHDHLPGSKGAFNAPALLAETVYLTEGAMDALALLESGEENAAAIFGPDGVALEWLQARRVVLCLDMDGTGRQATRDIAKALTLRGKRVFLLPEAVYRGQKDLNAALQAGGRLDLAGIRAELAEDREQELAEASREPAEPLEPGEPLEPREPGEPGEQWEQRDKREQGEPETSALYNERWKEHRAGCLQCTCDDKRPCAVGDGLRARYWELRREGR